MNLATIAVTTLSLIASALIVPAPADAKGCLKGAVVGGVGGRSAGHHAVLGALGGCVVGHHMANEKAKEEVAPQGAQNAPSVAPAQNPN